MAEGLLRAALKDRADVSVASAGVSALDGQSPSRSAVEACRALGIDITRQRSQQLDEDLIEWATHILVMTRGHLETIRLYFPEAEDKIRLVSEFDAARTCGIDVPDPIGLGLDAYISCRDALLKTIPGILKFIDESHPPMSSAATPAQPTPSSSSKRPLRLAIGADHAGLELKQAVATYLARRGEIVADLGTAS